MYDLRELYEVLENYIGEEPIITCNFNEMYRVYQIYEVYICLDKYDLLPSPCPDAASFRTNCRTAHALFPEFNPLHPPCQFHPPVSLYCTDPSSLDELNPPDEKSLESYLDTVDSDLPSDDDESQYFLENNPVNGLELQGA